jgi:4-amino-4-deoxy-L-arabinose transferase-like glycosyltransferase
VTHRSASRTPAFRSAPWWAAAAALLALRLPHLSGPLDDPHSWRQCDTAVCSLRFYRDGIDLLHPTVCWLGAHRTLIFEFPLVEALSALVARATHPGPTADRLVALGFFALASVYFHLIVRRLAGRRPAWLATLVWMALPLSQFYSRAAHVDFAATAFTHVLVYHLLRGFERRSLAHALVGGAGGALAAMIKAPIVLPVLAPLALVLLAAPALATFGLAALALGVTAIAFAVWRRHVDAVNAAAPDWSFLPGYYKEVNPLWWYFGAAHQRLEAASWGRLVRRLLFDLGWRDRRTSTTRVPAVPVGARAFGLAWLAGALLYLLVFFPLNVIHNYYQIPFLAPVALLAGLGLDWIWRLNRTAGIAALAVLVAGALVTVHALGYYRVDWLRVEAGQAIESQVPAGELVVAADYASGYSDPRLLARADRDGWSLAVPDLTPDRLARLQTLGARWVAVVSDPGHPGLAPPAFLDPRHVSHRGLVHQGQELGAIDLFDLGATRSRAPRPAGR